MNDMKIVMVDVNEIKPYKNNKAKAYLALGICSPNEPPLNEPPLNEPPLKNGNFLKEKNKL